MLLAQQAFTTLPFAEAGLSPANVTPISQCLDAVAHGGNPRRSALHRFYKTRAIMEADSRNYYLEKLLVIKPPILH
ncbi:hypothetical protein [Moorena sp. SIO4G3]|uniref:hypothetical protein n=1 Tax=Moorena sp. SIO4G3 TaxID=2607821 RepID=UPI00142973A0|nr:hypothetical protein [Moorena sp. SIO4G3]NEO80580.1 hypothetical protein [Moorena sp. SIO4G3]